MLYYKAFLSCYLSLCCGLPVFLLNIPCFKYLQHVWVLIPLSPSDFGARLRNDYYCPFPRHRLALKTCSHNEIYGHVFVETRNNTQAYNPVQTQSTQPRDIPMVGEVWSQWHRTRGRWHLSGIAETTGHRDPNLDVHLKFLIFETVVSSRRARITARITVSSTKEFQRMMSSNAILVLYLSKICDEHSDWMSW